MCVFIEVKPGFSLSLLSTQTSAQLTAPGSPDRTSEAGEGGFLLSSSACFAVGKLGLLFSQTGEQNSPVTVEPRRQDPVEEVADQRGAAGLRFCLSMVFVIF